MTDMLRYMIQNILWAVPFFLLGLLAVKVNLKKEIRCRQVLMPLLALLYGIVTSVILILFYDTITELIRAVWHWLRSREVLLNLYGQLTSRGISFHISDFIQSIGHSGVMQVIFGIIVTLDMLLYLVYKFFAIKILKHACKRDGSFMELVLLPFYRRSEENGAVYLLMNRTRSRGFLKVLYYTTLTVMTLVALASCYLFDQELLNMPVNPVFAVILVGEIYFFLCGITEEEARGSEAGEDDDARGIGSYAMLRDVLRALFGDKLSAENTETDRGIENPKTNNEVIEALFNGDDRQLEAYGYFIQHRSENGQEIDHNYVNAGRELLQGNSILFNNPFYYDLIPYIFYPMNRKLLLHGKVLIVLGRLDTEEEIIKWCEEGLVAVNNVPFLWKVGLLDGVEQEELDVGIITRSMVHDLALHEKNAAFLEKVSMIVLMEPSKLLTTAQIGLNSLVRYCSTEDRKPVFCSVDKNCDGLLDALSHVLMVSLTEVSATIHPSGDSSYMCWDGDGEHMQHRMVPNLSRYLGFGTELSFVALKNQVSETWWYGGDGFPVTDIRWIAAQYYHELLNYASLPASQETMDQCFHVSHKLWDAKRAKRLYITVEDESNNLFEVKRDFSTRATEDGFINVIAPEYLLKDYMTDNEDIFSADPKAIPCIVADYAHTKRNVAMRLCLRMSIGLVWESELIRELLLIEASTREPARSLWQAICDVNSSCSERHHGILTFDEGDRVWTFGEDVIRLKRKYNMRTASVENAYFIDNANFIRLYVNALKSAEYIAEDEQGNRMFLGSEIMGQIYQGHLPGQFVTMGGKHYEMLYVTADNRVVMRRAADHITGRPKYRQVREYTLSKLVPDPRMGSSRRRDGLQAQMFFADIDVRTPAYWRMNRYNDFETAHRIEVNGIPNRMYRNKRVLKLTFESKTQEITPDICRTLTVLINEVFATLYAENQCFIAAVMPGAAGVPITYTVQVEEDASTAAAGSGASGMAGSDAAAAGENASGANAGDPSAENCIYIIEDSQLDIGLLESVDRNLDRIFAILCDYLDWHGTHLEKSMNPPKEEEPVMPEAGDGEDEEKPKKKFILFRIFEKIKNFFKRLFEKIKNFFKKLFGRKKKKPEDGEGEGTGAGEGGETGSGAGGDAGTGEGGDTGNGEGGESGNGEGEGTGESGENGNGDGNETGTGEGDENGTGEGDETGYGEGDEAGTGDGDETGSSEGGESGTEDGNETGAGSEAGAGYGDNEGTGADDGDSEATGNGFGDNEGTWTGYGEDTGTEGSADAGNQGSSGNGPGAGEAAGSNNGGVAGSVYDVWTGNVWTENVWTDENGAAATADTDTSGNETDTEENVTGAAGATGNSEAGEAEAGNSESGEDPANAAADDTAGEEDDDPNNAYFPHLFLSVRPSAGTLHKAWMLGNEGSGFGGEEAEPEDGDGTGAGTDSGNGAEPEGDTNSGTGTDTENGTEPEGGADAGAGTEPGAEPTVEFEPDEAKKMDPAKMKPERKPYHERYYLLYGGTTEPEGIATKATRDFLVGLGYGNSELKQARDGKEVAGQIEDGFLPGQKGRHYCDFCGAMLTGTEYEVLSDGRERCMNCSRTAIRTEAEFKKLYKGVVSNMMKFYGIKITVPVHVRMVNAKRLHRALGKSFVPTGNMDGRTLGVAIMKKGTYTILLENGSPRLMSIMTMAHELTHIWQYCNWDQKQIRRQYGKENELLIYEGMAKWSEIQYAYLINEPATAKREDIITRLRDDEYGQGYLLYLEKYPLSRQSSLKGETPFMNIPPL